MAINKQKLKIHTINLSTLSKPVEIQHYFKTNKIEVYAYTFSFGKNILKHGYSSKAWRKNSLGERVYRQAHNIPLGWNSKPGRSSSGKDFKEVCDDFENMYGIKVDKNQTIITVYDMTQYPGISIRDPESYAREMEAMLIDEYVNVYGCRPIGNLRSETNNVPEVEDDRWKDAGFDV